MNQAVTIVNWVTNSPFNHPRRRSWDWKTILIVITNTIWYTKKGDLLVSISEATKLLLSSSIPAVESNLSTVCEKIQWVNLHTDGCYFGKAKMERKNKFRWNNMNNLNLNLFNYKLFLRSYFFSNSPVRCLFTKVVFPAKCSIHHKYHMPRYNNLEFYKRDMPLIKKN